jgi:hypothetical protein
VEARRGDIKTEKGSEAVLQNGEGGRFTRRDGAQAEEERRNLAKWVAVYDGEVMASFYKGGEAGGRGREAVVGSRRH